MSTEDDVFRDVTARAASWRAAQSWAGWSALPPGPEREQKRAEYLESYERFQERCDKGVRAVTEAEHAARGEAIWAAQCGRYGIPERVRDAVRAPQPSAACTKIARWLDGGGWFLCLSGGPGVGKTTAAALALTQERGFMVTATATSDHLFDRPWWAGLEAQPLVVIDDLGTEKQDSEGYWQARWRAFVDSRYRDKRKLVVTCNLPREVFLARYIAGDGGRTADRLRDGGLYSPVEGESLRVVDAVAVQEVLP